MFHPTNSYTRADLHRVGVSGYTVCEKEGAQAGKMKDVTTFFYPDGRYYYNFLFCLLAVARVQSTPSIPPHRTQAGASL